MRIAVFYNLAFGGAKRVVLEQIKGLKELQNTVDVYTLNQDTDPFSPEIFADNAYSYTFKESTQHMPFFSRAWNDYKVFVPLNTLHKKIAMDIKNRKYDIVLVHPDYFTQAPFLLRHLTIPSVYYCQEPLRIVYEYRLRFIDNVSIINKAYEELTRYIRKYIDRKNAQSATFSLASCCHIRERMIEVYDMYPRISYPGIDTKRFHIKNVKKRNQVLFVGNKEVLTDGYDLAKASIDLVPANIRPKLYVLSWKKNKNKRFSEDELITLYNESIITFCLSRFETFGLVPLESMACGVPVIATNISGHRETIKHQQSGFLVDFSPKEIAQKLSYLITKPDEQKAMGKFAREYVVREWSWRKRTQELHELLKEFRNARYDETHH